MTKANIVNLSRLDASGNHVVDYSLTEAEQSEMSRTNGWRKAENLEVHALFSPIDDGWQMDAKITGKVSLTCVISGAPIHFPINLSISRKYIKNFEDFPQDFSWEEDFDVEREELPRTLDLTELASEILLLELPQYPKLEKYEGDDAWQLTPDSHKGDHPDKVKPFANLKDLLAEKKNDDS